MDNRVLFIGGDIRMIHAAKAVSQRYEVHTLGLPFGMPAEGRYGAVVLPLPFSRGGYINAPLSEKPLPLSLIADYTERGGLVLTGMSDPDLSALCADSGLSLYDYFTEETLTLTNAALTAEAAVGLLIQNTDHSLRDADILITGGGRIAMLTGTLLRSFGSRVTICARSPLQRTKAQLRSISAAELSALPALCRDADIILNTPPVQLFSREDFSRMRQGALFMELASLPAKPNEDFAAGCGVKYIHAAGLPGKFSPRTAGEAIADTILSRLSQR